MKKALLAGITLISFAVPAEAFSLWSPPGLSLVSPTLNLNFGQGSASVPIVLPLSTKDPYAAYNLATIPVFGSFYASNYVGMNPLRSEPEPGLRRAAVNHLASDLALLAAGACAPAALGRSTATELMLGGAVGFGLSLLTRWWFYGPFWGQQAVRFNAEQFKALQYEPWYAPKAEPPAEPNPRPVTAPSAP